MQLLANNVKIISREQTAVVAVIGTASTGLGEFDQPISVAVVTLEVTLLKGNKVREISCFHESTEPTVPIHPAAFAVHGLTLEMLRGKRLNAQKLWDTLRPANVLVAHNAKFHRQLLAQFCPGIGLSTWSCSMWGSDYWRGNSLDSLCMEFSVSRPLPHNALANAMALSEVLFKRSGKTDKSSTFMGGLLRNPWAPDFLSQK